MTVRIDLILLVVPDWAIYTLIALWLISTLLYVVRFFAPWRKQ